MTVFTIEQLNALAGRLRNHSEDFADAFGFESAVADMRLAIRVYHNLAVLRFRVLEIAEQALSQDGAATRRDLVMAVGDAEF
jgi:hypothetical protein